MAYGPEHASTVETLYSLLNLYAKQGRDADAEALCMPYLQALVERDESNEYGKGPGLAAPTGRKERPRARGVLEENIWSEVSGSSHVLLL